MVVLVWEVYDKSALISTTVAGVLENALGVYVTHVEQPSGNTIAPSQIFEGVDFLFLWRPKAARDSTRTRQKKKNTKIEH